MYYVTMTDTFMSGWGRAAGRINKLVFECESLTEAEIVRDNALSRGEMKYVNIVHNKPYYPVRTHLTQYKNKEQAPVWYERGSFSR